MVRSETEKAALAPPPQRYVANTHETPGRELDWLSASEDGLDDIGCQKGELYSTAHLAGVVTITICDLPSRPNFSSGQLAEPSMGPGDQGYEFCVWHRAITLRAADDAEGRAIAEARERQLFYVGCTRARDLLRISFAGDPSPFIGGGET